MNNHLRDWLAQAPNSRRESVAAEAGTTVGHLWQLSGGHRRASAELAMRLQKASGGEITLAGLRPDISELVQQSLKDSAA
ncbi:MAG: hypothetical protein CMK78_11465 [Pseudomonadales bacterium]|nr:hypothetical protein [Pseudomonadales bacterium]|tara:strand:- start:184 stop:423 length:240 start_codon:yes stop_codon:yes gene_type:complete